MISSCSDVSREVVECGDDPEDELPPRKKCHISWYIPLLFLMRFGVDSARDEL